MQSQPLRLGSAPASSIVPEGGHAQRDLEESIAVEQVRQSHSKPSKESHAERQRAPSAPASDVKAVERQSPASKKRPASASPRGSHANIEPKKASKHDADLEQGAQQTAVYARDFAKTGDEVISGHEATQPEQEAKPEADSPASKRIKSDIAPWMTQRHKNAIRRSLGGADPSPDTPDPSSPVKAVPVASEESLHVSNTRQQS